MAPREIPGPEGVQHRLMAQQPQLVGHGALAFADALVGLLLAHAPLAQQLGNGPGTPRYNPGPAAGYSPPAPPGVDSRSSIFIMMQGISVSPACWRPEPPLPAMSSYCPPPAARTRAAKCRAGEWIPPGRKAPPAGTAPGLGGIGTDGFGGQEYHPAGFHIGS